MWSEVQTELAVATRVRLQSQNTEDESRGTTQTCTAKSYERSLRSGRAGVVKVSQILRLWCGYARFYNETNSTQVGNRQPSLYLCSSQEATERNSNTELELASFQGSSPPPK